MKNKCLLGSTRWWILHPILPAAPVHGIAHLYIWSSAQIYVLYVKVHNLYVHWQNAEMQQKWCQSCTWKCITEWNNTGGAHSYISPLTPSIFCMVLFQFAQSHAMNHWKGQLFLQEASPRGWFLIAFQVLHSLLKQEHPRFVSNCFHTDAKEQLPG